MIEQTLPSCSYSVSKATIIPTSSKKPSRSRLTAPVRAYNGSFDESMASRDELAAEFAQISDPDKMNRLAKHLDLLYSVQQVHLTLGLH